MNYKYFINDELYADLNEEKAFLDLSEIIKCKTISNPNQELMDFNEFDKLHNILKNNFPLVVKNSEIEVINKGSILFHLKGENESLPELLLMAHIDVVPVVEATVNEWDYPAFSGEITDEFIEYVANSKIVEHYFDIPFQHASNKILKAMNRHATKEQALEIVNKIKKANVNDPNLQKYFYLPKL